MIVDEALKDNEGQLEVPVTRGHRGADPRDADCFGPSSMSALRGAVSHFSWLLGHGYAPVSALKLVGDRWRLTERQRMAVRRSACSDEARARERACEVFAADVAGRVLWIDGFNVLTTIEAWLGGAVVLHCRDGTYRDLAGIHGTYRRVAETLPALEVLADVLGGLGVGCVRWLFDRPVSNSGRIRELVRNTAAEGSLNWSVELVPNPDPLLAQSSEIVATADSAILDAGPRWFNLVHHVIETSAGRTPALDLERFTIESRTLGGNANTPPEPPLGKGGRGNGPVLLNSPPPYEGGVRGGSFGRGLRAYASQS